MLLTFLTVVVYRNCWFFFSGVAIVSLQDDNVCTTEEPPGKDEEIPLSLMSNIDDGEYDNDLLEETMYHEAD